MKTTMTIEVDCEIFYSFEPSERETSDCPGSGASADIEHIFIGFFDIMPALSKKEIESLEEKCIEDAEERGVDAYESAMEARAEARSER